MRVKVIVVGCSPAWPNPGGAQSGYLVEGDGRLLLDCGPGELARDADIFLCEATLRSPEPAERGHLTAAEAEEAFRASGARRLVVIHRPDELPLDSGIERAADGDVLTF